MDFLDGLWELYEQELTEKTLLGDNPNRLQTQKQPQRPGYADVRKPQPKPELRPQSELEPVTNKTPNQVMQSNPAANANLSPELSKSQQVDDLRKSGVPTGQAFQQVHGDIDDFSDQAKVGDVASAFGRTQSDKSTAQSVRIDKDSESLLGQDHLERSQDTAPTQVDAMSGQNSEVSDEDQEENTGAPQPIGGTKLEPEQELTPEQELDTDIESIKNTLGSQEDSPESIEYKSQQTQPEITPRQQASEEERKQSIIDSLNRMMEAPEKKTGAGANKLSREDAELLKKYISGEGPKLERMEISDDDMAFARDYLKKNFKQAFTKLKLGTKGAPKELYEGRGDAVLKSYLANKGLSAVTGEPLPYSASELDHITSLGNGGVDGFDNWAWVDKRYNQFMSSLDDDGVLKKVDKLLSMNPDDERLKELKSELTNETRSRYTTYFKKKGFNHVTMEDIQGAKGEAGNQMLKALASAAGVNTYKGSDDRTRARGRFIGYPALKKALIDKIKPVTDNQQEEFDDALMEIKKFIEEKTMEMEPFTKRGRKKRKTIKEAYLEWLLETKFGFTFIQEEVEEEDEVDIIEEEDYNDDVDFLRTYGRA